MEHGNLLWSLCGSLVMGQKLLVNTPVALQSSVTHTQRHCGAEAGDGIVAFIDSGLLIKVKQTLSMCVYV